MKKKIREMSIKHFQMFTLQPAKKTEWKKRKSVYLNTNYSCIAV